MGINVVHVREDWESLKKEHKRRMAKAKPLTEGGNSKVVETSGAVALLEAIICP